MKDRETMCKCKNYKCIRQVKDGIYITGICTLSEEDVFHCLIKDTDALTFKLVMAQIRETALLKPSNYGSIAHAQRMARHDNRTPQDDAADRG